MRISSGYVLTCLPRLCAHLIASVTSESRGPIVCFSSFPNCPPFIGDNSALRLSRSVLPACSCHTVHALPPPASHRGLCVPAQTSTVDENACFEKKGGMMIKIHFAFVSCRSTAWCRLLSYNTCITVPKFARRCWLLPVQSSMQAAVNAG